MNPAIARPLRSLQRNILAGLITAGPLFVTWLVFSFVFGTLAKAGLPLVQLLAAIFPEEWLATPWLRPSANSRGKAGMGAVPVLPAAFVRGSTGRATAPPMSRPAAARAESATPHGSRDGARWAG